MDVRERILVAGCELLKAQGIAALTQLKVAAAAGVKQSHLTYYFPKRSDLLLGIAEFAIQGVLGELEARLADTPPAQAVSRVFENAILNGVPPRLFLGLIVAAEEEPGIREPLTRLIRMGRARMRALLAQAGVPDPDGSAVLLHAGVVGLSVLHHAQHTALSEQEAKAGVAGLFRLLAAPATTADATTPLAETSDSRPPERAGETPPPASAASHRPTAPETGA